MFNCTASALRIGIYEQFVYSETSKELYLHLHFLGLVSVMIVHSGDTVYSDIVLQTIQGLLSC